MFLVSNADRKSERRSTDVEGSARRAGAAAEPGAARPGAMISAG